PLLVERPWLRARAIRPALPAKFADERSVFFKGSSGARGRLALAIANASTGDSGGMLHKPYSDPNLREGAAWRVSRKRLPIGAQIGRTRIISELEIPGKPGLSRRRQRAKTPNSANTRAGAKLGGVQAEFRRSSWADFVGGVQAELAAHYLPLIFSLHVRMSMFILLGTRHSSPGL